MQSVNTPVGSERENPQGYQDHYQFAKGPDVRRVSPGDLVEYTFSNFGNHRGVALEQFSIIDRPDRGIDIVSIGLPRFKDGENVSYSLFYFTRSGGDTQQVIAENVSANRASTFRVPRPRPGDYVNMITIEFGMVPAEFAVGDNFQMTFRVCDNPPARTLTNIGMLSYRINEKYYEYITCSIEGSIVIGGWFGSPQTGDDGVSKWHWLGIISSMVIVNNFSKPQRRKLLRLFSK